MKLMGCESEAHCPPDDGDGPGPTARRSAEGLRAPLDRDSPFLATLLLPHLAGRAASEPVFVGARSATYLRNAVFRHGLFNPAATAIGLEGLTPHELRHTTASLAVGAGANVKAVQRMLGPASAAMTLDTYTDLFDDDLEAVATALDHPAMQTDVANLLPGVAVAPRQPASQTRKTPGQTGGFSS